MAGKTLLVLACVFFAVINAEQYYKNPKFRVFKANDPGQFVFEQKPVQSDPIKLVGGGGGSPNTGYDVFVGAEKKIWESDDGKNSLHASGTYGQHLGGPYGNSQPSYSGGLMFSHHFG